MSARSFDPSKPEDLTASWPPPQRGDADIKMELNALPLDAFDKLPPLDTIASSDLGLKRQPIGSLLADTVGPDAAKLFGHPGDIEAQMLNAAYISGKEAVPLSVVVPLLPFYQEKYSQEVLGETYQGPVRFLEKTQQPISAEQARYLNLTSAERVEMKKRQYNIILGQPGYGAEPPELSPDGLSIDTRQQKIEELKIKEQEERAIGMKGGFLSGLPDRARSELESVEARQALHIANTQHWREQLITPQNITERALKEVGAHENDITYTINNRSFQTWARDYHGVNVGDPFSLPEGERNSALTDPRVRRLAEEYLITRPGSGEILWDTISRGMKGAFSNTGSAVSGSLGVAFSAAGFENLGLALQNLAEGAQMEATNSTDRRLDGTVAATVAEGVGELAVYSLTGSAVGGLYRAAGAGEQAAAMATTLATGGLSGAENAYTVYQEAKAAGASEENARLAAGWGFVAGATTSIPVTKWSLTVERGAETFVPLSRMTVEALEAGSQNALLELSNNAIAQQIYDQNRQLMEGTVGAFALGAGTGSILSFLASVVGNGREVTTKNDANSQIPRSIATSPEHSENGQITLGSNKKEEGIVGSHNSFEGKEINLMETGGSSTPSEILRDLPEPDISLIHEEVNGSTTSIEDARYAVDTFNRQNVRLGNNWRIALIGERSATADLEQAAAAGLYLPQLEGRSDAERLSHALARLFGQRIVKVSFVGADVPKVNAFVNSSDKLRGFIFFNEDVSRPHMLTLGHELWHSLNVSNPELAEQIRNILHQEVRNWDLINAEKSHYDSELRFDEVIGDTLGDALSRRSFWDRLAARDPVVFGKFATVVKAWLDKVEEALRRAGYGSNRYFRDIEHVRDILADALVEFQRKPNGNARKLGPYEPNDPNQLYYSKRQDAPTKSTSLADQASQFESETDTLVYEDAPYHKEHVSGRKSPRPKNGQKALNQSIEIASTTPRRTAIDFENHEFIIFDQTEENSRKFHGHVRPWEELPIKAKNALIKAGLVNRKGKILISKDNEISGN